MTSVLKRVRKEELPVIDKPEALINEVHLDEANNFNKEKFNIRTVYDELYSYIIRKFNNQK